MNAGAQDDPRTGVIMARSVDGQERIGWTTMTAMKDMLQGFRSPIEFLRVDQFANA